MLPFTIVSKQSIQIPEEKIQAYYDAHQDEFKTLEQVSVDYVQLSLKDLMDHIHLTEEELKDFYQENQSSFVEPARVNPSPQSFEQAKPRVEERLKQQKAEEQFSDIREKLASSSYEHPESLEATSQLLNLPIKTSELFSKDKAGKDISANNKVREAAFSHDVLNLQNNSDVISLTPDSVVVIHVKTHELSSKLPLQAVRAPILDKLTQSEVEAKTLQIAEEIISKLKNNDQSNPILQNYHLNWNNVGWIARHATNVNPAILEMAFNMRRPEANHSVTYQATKLSEGYAIVALDEVKDGELTDKDEYKVFDEQIQNTQGLLEYELYKQSVVDQAQIVVQ
jgi:peptidyl-prolyl cis-trans isomerase D